MLFLAKPRSFLETKPLQNGDIILSFTDVGKLGPSHEILTSQICLNAICENIILTKISGYRVFKHIILKRFLLVKKS